MKLSDAKNMLQSSGLIFGKGYSGLENNAAQIADDIEVAANKALKDIVDTSSTSGCLLQLGNIILFITGSVLFFISLADSSFWQAWFWISALWVVGVVFAFIRRSDLDIRLDNEELFDAFFDSAVAEIETRRTAKVNVAHEIPEKLRGEKPAPQPYGVSHEGAEALCAEWMKYLGELDADFTRLVGDGGIDVYSARYIGQVKNYSGSVGVAAIRELAGVSAVDGRRPVFFTSGSYASGAIDFANKTGMTLFIYDAVQGTLVGGNQKGETALEHGL